MIKIEGVDPNMIANNLIPFEPTHPGEIIKDEIEYRGLSQRKLAAQMGISYMLLNEILYLRTMPYSLKPRLAFLHKFGFVCRPSTTCK
jgi:hypothetical protein